MNTEKLVSVVIPTYNRSKVIERSILSVVKQSYPNIEILVCDDFSTDDTAGIVKNMQKTYGNIRFLQRRDRKKGGNAARNNGIENARGDYIAFLDSDDVFTENSVADRVLAFDRHPEADLVYGNVLLNGEKVVYDDISLFSPKKYMMHELSLCCFIVIMVKREAFRQVPLLDMELPAWQDDGLVLSFVMNDKKLLHCGKTLADILVVDIGVSASYGRRYKGCKRLVRQYKKDIIKECSIFRYILWQLRILMNWIISKSQERKGMLRWICNKCAAVLRIFLNPFYYHIYG